MRPRGREEAATSRLSRNPARRCAEARGSGRKETTGPGRGRRVGKQGLLAPYLSDSLL